MTLALAHSNAAPPFNGLFYATVATVIPVLFLAIALQGGTYRQLMDAHSLKFALIQARDARAEGLRPPDRLESSARRSRRPGPRTDGSPGA